MPMTRAYILPALGGRIMFAANQGVGVCVREAKYDRTTWW